MHGDDIGSIAMRPSSAHATSCTPLVLASHALCPFVQRAAIVLAEKGVPFTRREIDLAHKPDWFLAVSPLGKTPVLLVGGNAHGEGAQALFESAVICEYLDDMAVPRLHPLDPLARARHRAWMEFGSGVLATIASFYNAGDAAALGASRATLRARFVQLEAACHARGPWFDGAAFSMVDAVFAPVFRYFDAFEALGQPSFFDDTPRLRRWRAGLAQRSSVRGAVAPDFDQRLLRFLRARPFALACA
jgi:glutathione S-transferase